jgi:glycosyltransferase involved in cell wall biosynthesis
MEIHVGCLDEGGALLDDLAARGIPTRVFGKRPVPLDWGLVARLRRYLRQEGITVLHSHNTGCMLYGALAAAANRGVRVVHTDHGRSDPDSIKVFLEERIACRKCRRVVAVSHPLARYLESQVRIPREKIEVITNGVDLERFRLPGGERSFRESFRHESGWSEEDVVLGLTARMDPVKNLPGLVRLFSRLAAGHPQARLLLVGDGPERETVRRLVSELGLESIVRLVPWSDDIAVYYHCMDILVLCSLSEGTSMTVLEAMASGLPVAASRVGGNSELVADGQTGWLFDPDAEDQFLELLAPLIARPDLRQAMGRRGRERVETHFGLGGMLARYARLYRQAAAGDFSGGGP